MLVAEIRRPSGKLVTPGNHHQPGSRIRTFPRSVRRRQLLSDSVPVEFGTGVFDVRLVLLDADGALVTKEELLNRLWSGISVSEGT